MTAIIIGISSAFLIILVFVFLKNLDKKVIYGLILSGIGFLYIGFEWADSQALIVTSIQAIIFLFLAYYGTKRSAYIMAMGYFLHGGWDLAYSFLTESKFVPPHYDLFCSFLDFTIGAYILVFRKQFEFKKIISKNVISTDH